MPGCDKHVLALRGPVHEVWRGVFNAMSRSGWEVHECDSDLLLVSRLGQVTGRLVLCVGSIESLPPRPGRLLSWLTQRGVTCCVWATRHSSWEQFEQVQSLGVPVFTRREAFDAWVEHLERALPVSSEDLPREDHVVSDAELAVLFGDHGNE